MTPITEERETAQATATSEPPKPTKKASVAPRRAHVASSKAKSGKKASPAKEVRQSAQESHVGESRGCPRRQQDGQSAGPAETARRRHRQGCLS